MTDNTTIMELPIETLVKLCLLRREDVRGAMKEATKIFYKEDPAYKAKMAEYQRNWYLKNKSRHLENSKRWRERNKENLREYRKRYYERRKAAAFQPEEPKRRTDKQWVEFWDEQINEYDRKYNNNEIGFEEWWRATNIYVSHRDAAERRMKSKKNIKQ